MRRRQAAAGRGRVVHDAYFALRFGYRDRAEVLAELSDDEVMLIAAIENGTAGSGCLLEVIERHAGPVDAPPC